MNRLPFRVADASEKAGADTETVGQLAQLYLGNILFAIERCAIALDEDGKPLDAAFYRGIGRKLADAHGQSKRAT